MAGKISSLDDVFVRNVEGEHQMRISLILNDHKYDMLRSKDELLKSTLRRIKIRVNQITLDEGNTKKKRKKSQINSSDLEGVDVSLLINGRSVDGSASNNASWVDGALLQIGSFKGVVRVNPPRVISLEVPGCCMGGYAVVPRVEMEFVDPERCTWKWRRHLKSESSASVNLLTNQSPQSHWPTISTDFVYWPTLSDIGHTLLVECIPVNYEGIEGLPAASPSKSVAPGVEGCPFEKSHLLTPHFTSEENIRVVSYNVLADVYASSEFAKEKLYPYCPPQYLDIDYRQSLIEKELLGYHGDVICLQELGDRCFHHYLKPVMEQKGYSAHLKMKEGQILEGESIFLRKARLRAVAEYSTSLTKFLLKHDHAAKLFDHLKVYPRLLSFLAGKHSVVQIIIAQVLDKKSPPFYLAIGNTHLYYRPTGDHIRLLQAYIGLLALSSAIEEFKEKMKTDTNQDVTVAALFCGDFNSSPENGVRELFVNGRVSASHKDWSMSAVYEREKHQKHLQYIREKAKEKNQVKEERNDPLIDILNEMGIAQPREIFNKTADQPVPEVFLGLDLSHSFSFTSACGEPRYTNFTRDFQDTLDYMFMDNAYFSGASMMPLPSHEDVTKNGYLPSPNFPSDHLPLVCDLKWK